MEKSEDSRTFAHARWTSPVRKGNEGLRDLRDPVRGPQFLSGEEASNDDVFMSTDTGPNDQRFGIRPIPEQQDDLSRRVPRKPMRQPKHVAHPSGSLGRTCENHASAGG